MQDERRSWERVKVDLQAKCRLVDAAAYSLCQITDIHHEGCCLEGNTDFLLGQELRLVVRIPIEGEIYLIGTVCWSRRDHKGEFNTGLKFVVSGQLAEENAAKLYSFCVSR